MGLAEVGAIVTGIGVIVGLIYAALRFQREDAGTVVSQMTEVLAGMREVHGVTTKALEICRSERLAAEGLAREHREKWEAAEAELADAVRQIGELRAALDE